MNNYTRRSFIRNLLTDVYFIFDEIKGNDNLPLNKVRYLPDSVISNIRPVFFPECKIRVLNSTLHKKTIVDKDWQMVKQLSDLELLAIQKFSNGQSLKETVEFCQAASNLDIESIFLEVKSFFLVLIEHRICHPDKKYQLEDLNLESMNKR
ncbi:MAG: hypothetical protein PHO32_03425 [Candidatus Cloacimonetes bacterium]|nr:hypothetical protein [Candidatus Cloacimonadota bacterium]